MRFVILSLGWAVATLVAGKVAALPVPVDVVIVAGD